MKNFGYGWWLAGMLLAVVQPMTQAQTLVHDLSTRPWQVWEKGKTDTLKATVPGCIHTDLLAAGKIADPFFRDNESKLQWVGERDWVYATMFDVQYDKFRTAKNHDLVFEGLDTYAEVYLNGRNLLKTNNMFRTWRVSIPKDALKLKDNKLEVVFTSPFAVATPLLKAHPFRLPAPNDAAEDKISPYVRKAPYHFGWDWGPRYVTAGIWRPVRLESWDNARIEYTYFHTSKLSTDSARVEGLVEVVADRPVNSTVSVSLGGKTVSQRAYLQFGKNLLKFSVPVAKPIWWWPHNLGKPHLYDIKTEVKVNNAVIAEKAEKIGLRTIRVENQRDAQGKSFTVFVNGQPTFMKGANYIPQDMFLNRVSKAHNRKLLGDAVAANMNMLRVWGGGVYESDDFYQVADSLGLLLWQDFMFACSYYPSDTAFLKNVEAELRDNIRRLAGHPSIALWCGNNEMEVGYKYWGLIKRYQHSPADSAALWDHYKYMFHQFIPQIVKEEDPYRFYHRSSPSANEEDPNMNTDKPGWGDRHDWSVWFSKVKFTAYKKNVSRFVSEYGFQSFPTFQALNSFTEPADLDAETPVMVAHQKHTNGNAKIRRFMSDYYKVPTAFPTFVYASQYLQAEAMKMGVETHRRSKPFCWGTLYWQINDVWPVVSWASIDYSGQWKATHYLVTKANANALVVPSLDSGMVRIHVVNDELKAQKQSLSWQLLDFQGKVLKSGKESFTSEANSSAVRFTQSAAQLLEGQDTTQVFLHLRLMQGSQVLSENSLTFKEYKDLALPASTPQVFWKKADKDGKVWTASVRSSVWTKGLELRLPMACRWSDNFVDVLPNQTRTLTLTLPKAVSQADLEKGLELYSINQLK